MGFWVEWGSLFAENGSVDGSWVINIPPSSNVIATASLSLVDGLQNEGASASAYVADADIHIPGQFVDHQVISAPVFAWSNPYALVSDVIFGMDVTNCAAKGAFLLVSF